MRKTFARFDDFLIERLFQPASALITDWTSLSRARAICCCLDIASTAWIISRTRALSDAVNAWHITASCLGICFLLLGLTALISLRILFRRPRSRLGNPLRPAMQPHRAVVLLMLAASLLQPQAAAEMADMVMLVFAAFGLYLGACAEQPPLQRRWTTFASAN